MACLEGSVNFYCLVALCYSFALQFLLLHTFYKEIH